MPIFQIGGSGWGVMGLYHGARGVIAREFDPTKVLDFFEQSGITKLFMVPAAMQFVVRQPRAREIDFSRLKYMLYGASPIPAALLKECIEVFKCGFVQMYGMTETTGTIVALPPEDHIEGLDRMRSAGKALPGIELAILDANGNRLPPGEVGEIATRSGSNMAGYWNLPEATARTIDKDGWLRTGDAGYMDKDGYLYIHDRIKDVRADKKCRFDGHFFSRRCRGNSRGNGSAGLIDQPIGLINSLVGVARCSLMSGSYID